MRKMRAKPILLDKINEKKSEKLEQNIENAEVEEKADVEIELKSKGW